jgi:hypothetical protein
MIVFTDGYETDSTKYQLMNLRSMIDDKQKTGFWSFVMMGAGNNAKVNALALGFPEGNCGDFAITQMESAFDDMSRLTVASALQPELHCMSFINRAVDNIADAEVDPMTEVPGVSESEKKKMH